MTIIWNWPQIVWAVLMGVSVVGTAFLDGRPKSGNYSFATTAVCTILSFILLYFGGFFMGAQP